MAKKKVKGAGDVAGAGVDVRPMPRAITTNDMRIERVPTKPRPMIPGPAHDGQGGISILGQAGASGGDVGYIATNATAAELRYFTEMIQARLNAKESPKVSLPDGTMLRGNSILAGCPTCGIWEWVEPQHIGRNCLMCNYGNRVGHRGILRRATEKETAAWYDRERARLARVAAGAGDRKKDREAWHHRREQDGRL